VIVVKYYARSSKERAHLKKLIADLKKTHTAEVLATVERAARAFNLSADEGKIQTIVSNAIKTSTLAETTPHLEVVNQPKPTEEYKQSLVSQAQPEPAAQVNQVFLYCFTAARTYTIWGVAKQLNGGDFRATCADVVSTLGRR